MPPEKLEVSILLPPMLLLEPWFLKVGLWALWVLWNVWDLLLLLWPLCLLLDLNCRLILQRQKLFVGKLVI